MMPVGSPARLEPKKAFVDIAGKTYPPTTTNEQKNAALFYAAINSTSVGGVSPATDGLTQQTVTDSVSGLTYYKDAWGTPITFKRWANVAELQSGAALRPSMVQLSVTAGGGKFAVNNPLDPAGKLFVGARPPSENPWGNPANPARLQCLSQATGTNNPAGGINLADFTNENFLPTLISYGPNKLPGAGGRSFPTLTNPAVDDDMADNLYSFRVRREGARGD
jgi:hypothetical protein